MNRFPLRLAALVVCLAAAAALGACSRENKILNPVVSGPVTWENTVKHLIADRSEGTAPTGCTSCHHAGTTISDFSVYDNVAGDSDTLKSIISPTGRMARFLQPGEAQVIIDWINAGAPQQ